MSSISVFGGRLDELQFGFHLFEEGLLGLELGAGFFDELLWSLFDVMWVRETVLESVDFLAKFEDALLEIMLVFIENILWDLEIDAVARDGEAEAAKFFSWKLWHARSFGEVLDEELVGVHERIIAEGDWVSDGAREALEVTADVDDDVLELFELLDALSVDFVEFWPFLVNQHAVGPAEGLPDSLSDKWGEWVKHDEDLLKSGFEKGGIFPEFFAFEEPVGVFVPDEIVEKIACFGEAVVVEKLLQLFVGLIEVVANPIFTIVVDGELLVAFGVFVDNLLDKAGDVPELIAEVATSDDFTGAEGLVDTGGAAGDEAEAKGVGAILADDFHWIDDVALGFGHLLAFFI